MVFVVTAASVVSALVAYVEVDAVRMYGTGLLDLVPCLASALASRSSWCAAYMLSPRLAAD